MTTTHRSTRRRISGRARALMSLGAVAALATGLSAQGTFAFFTDSATINAGSFTTGTLDITLNGALAGAANSGGSTTLTAFTLANMVPGESRAADFPVANAGTVPLLYSLTGSATGAGNANYTFQVYVGGTASNPVLANGLRTGACTGTSLANAQTFSATPTTLIAPANARTLVPTGTTPGTTSETVCVVASLPGATDNTAQGRTVTASLVFDSKQVGAP